MGSTEETSKRDASVLSPLEGHSKYRRTTTIDTTKKIEINIPQDTPSWLRTILLTFLDHIQSLEDCANFTEECGSEALDKATAMDDTIRKVDQDLTDKIYKLEKQISEVKKEQKLLYNRMLNLESYSRRDNLLVCGVPESASLEEEDCMAKVRAIFTGIGVENADDMKIVRCHRKGPYKRDFMRPIIVRFHWAGDRNSVWNNKAKLKDINSKQFITEDYPSEVETNRRKLWPCYKAAKALEKYRNRVKMSGDKLILEGIVYTVDTMESLPQDVHPWTVSSATNEDSFAFFTSANPLSNHYPCSFTVDNTAFNCGEQYLMYSKAMAFNDYATARKILATKNPVTQKYLGSEIENFNLQQWKKKAPQVIKKGLLEKFKTNPKCQQYLLRTGSKQIVEAAGPRDQYWGIGVFIRSDDVLNKSKWKGFNLLGKTLMEIRSELFK